jgi:hypothetical protein
MFPFLILEVIEIEVGLDRWIIETALCRIAPASGSFVYIVTSSFHCSHPRGPCRIPLTSSHLTFTPPSRYSLAMDNSYPPYMHEHDDATTTQDQLSENVHVPKKRKLDNASAEPHDFVMEQGQPAGIVRHLNALICGSPLTGFDTDVAQTPFFRKNILSAMALKGYGRTVHVGSEEDSTCFEAYIGRNKLSVLAGGCGVPVNEFVNFVNSTIGPLQHRISMADFQSHDTFLIPYETPCSAPPLERCLHMYVAVITAQGYGLRPFMESLRNYAMMYRPPRDFYCAHCRAPISVVNGSSDAESHGSHTHSDIWDSGAIYCCFLHRFVFFTEQSVFLHCPDCWNFPSTCHTGGHDASLSSVTSSPISRMDLKSNHPRMQSGYRSVVYFEAPVPFHGFYPIRVEWGRVALRDLLAFCFGVYYTNENGVTWTVKQDHPDRADEGSMEVLILHEMRRTPEIWLLFSHAVVLAKQYGLFAKLAPVWGLVTLHNTKMSETIMCTDCGMSILLNTSGNRIQHSCEHPPRFPVDLYK